MKNETYRNGKSEIINTLLNCRTYVINICVEQICYVVFKITYGMEIIIEIEYIHLSMLIFFKQSLLCRRIGKALPLL